ncbi:hypothetical protein EPUS_03007 [Endocarpon pusillum Z07020]|uniref:Membrane insertase YidC/Oxa/ALB C-terminal domain-containing protein n=1 Tax=Endocarpon pusillum (strain Z07020 / HMAS-L-300199) TaxID=1263415 RepID=U1GMQ2_ENDPU|nr:uncharacterized protein EPUS_03007 [Endocarpon pusillum Z07020]ERF73166.1 hypothetical protein EPUS_03007 [Endocarpon pusillum Z07020]
MFALVWRCYKQWPAPYSVTSSRATLFTRHAARSRQQAIYQPTAAQIRSISLWGWGSSSSSKDADFAKVHTSQSSSVPDAAVGQHGHTPAQGITPSSPSIPAVHHTSDSPPPTSIPVAPNSTPSGVIASPVDQSVILPAKTPSVDALDPAKTLSEIPERIGYLKEVCGLDFGWGPSSMMQWIVEHIHIDGDVSWTTSIILLAAFSRLLILFPMIQASDSGAKLKAAEPVLRPVKERMKAAYKAGDHRKMVEARTELKELNKEYGLSSWKMLIPTLIQIPAQFGAFRVLRNMAELPVPALEKESWFWAHDLTLGDPYYVVPFINALVVYLTIKRGGEMGTTQMQGGIMILLSYIMPCISFIFMSIQPGTVQLYFFVSSLIAFIQARILTNKLFRKALALHPTVPNPKKLISPSITPGAGPGSNNTNTTTTLTTTTTPATNTIIPAIGPAGLKLYQPPHPSRTDNPLEPSTASSSSPSQPQQANISLIDKVVNQAKSQASEAREGWDAAWGTTKEKKQKEAEINKIKAEAQRYETKMSREHEWNRERINRKRKQRAERRS